MSTLSMPANGYVLRSVPETAAPKPRKRASKLRKLLVAGVLALTATVGLLAGAGISNTGTTQSASAWDPIGDAFCANPTMGDKVAISPWPGNAAAFNLDDMPNSNISKSVAAAASSGGGDGSASKNFTAYEWYGTNGQIQHQYGWKAELGDQIAGCTRMLNVTNLIPDLLMSLNTLIGSFTIAVISWITTWDIVSIFFADSNGVLPSIITGLKDALFLNYLAPIVMISAIFLGYRGLVKKQTRDGLQGIIWMFGAAAAALTFMTNPVWFATTADTVVYKTSSWIIDSATAAGGNLGASNMCSLPDGAPDRAVRMVQCDLWETFDYTPWAAGQIGSGAMDTSVDTAHPATFRPGSAVSTQLPIMILDATTYNRLQTAAANGNSETLAALDATKQSQWQDVAKTVTNKADLNVVRGWALWSGSDFAGRFGGAVLAVTAQLIASIPLLVLGFGMIGQQIMFIFLLTLAPVFLTIGINPGYGRRLSLGWLEMILGTLVKRVVLAGMIGVLLGYFSAVIAARQTLEVVGGSVFAILLLCAGSIAMLIFRGKILKRAGDMIELDGVRTSDDGKTKAFLTGLGSGIVGSVAGGIGSKMGGGSFTEGAKNNMSNPLTGVVPGAGHVSTAMKERKRASTVDTPAVPDATGNGSAPQGKQAPVETGTGQATREAAGNAQAPSFELEPPEAPAAAPRRPSPTPASGSSGAPAQQVVPEPAAAPAREPQDSAASAVKTPTRPAAANAKTPPASPPAPPAPMS